MLLRVLWKAESSEPLLLLHAEYAAGEGLEEADAASGRGTCLEKAFRTKPQ